MEKIILSDEEHVGEAPHLASEVIFFLTLICRNSVIVGILPRKYSFARFIYCSHVPLLYLPFHSDVVIVIIFLYFHLLISICSFEGC